MKNNYFLLALLIMLGNFALAQQFITPTSYRGAFAPSPTAMWTDQWTNFDPQNTNYPAPTVNVISEITTDTHWTANNVYYLKAQIYVKTGATLTIDPGTIIRADHTAVGAGLFVTKGSKLIANGTASQPIVFTSDNPVGQRNKGDWGGIILLGKGSFNLNGGINNIEGIAPSADTQYGGGTNPDDNDNSGSLQYVRIEYAGYVYAPNNEINGLTFGAVGRGTTIDYVQVSFANDDAFEWFGGAVNCKHLVAYRNLDDDFDTDNGFSGKVQFCLSVRDPQISDNPSVSTSEGFESDNNASSSAVSPYTAAIFSNCTMVGPYYRLGLPNGGTIASGYKRGARIRRNSQLKIYNSVFMDYLEGVHIDGLTTETNALNGTLQFRNNIIAGTVTTSKVFQVNASGNNASFNIGTWYAASNNTTLTSSASLLTKAYELTNAQTYTGLDYRPATGSALLNSADFSEAQLAAVTLLTAPEVTAVSYCKGAVASPLTATLTGAGVSLKWYTTATGTTALTTAPTPSTATVGTITYYVSQVNAAGVQSPRAALTVTTLALPTTPGVIAGVAAQSVNIGTTTAVTYSITPLVDAVSYNWTAPAGVTILTGQGTNTITVNFAGVAAGAGAIGNLSVVGVNANGCSSLAKTLALTKVLPATPTALVLTNGITTTAITNISLFVGTTTELTLTATAATATSFTWTLPAGVNQISGGNSNVITVNFAGVAPGIGSVVLGVNAVNGVGTSAAAKTLSVAKTLPATPSALVLTNGVTTTAFTDVSKYIGTTTPLTLTATAVTATSFEWILPAGVTQLSGGNTRTITVNFAGFAAGDLTSIPVNVKSVNGVGTSLLSKTLTLLRKLPSAVSVVTGQTTGICPNSTVNYTITAPVNATSYIITVPVGSTITSVSNPDNTTNTLATSDLTFTVNYSSNIATVTPKTIVLTAVNGVGNSLANKTITLSNTMAVTSITGGTLFNRCNTITFTGNAIGAVNYIWTTTNGATVVSGNGTNSVVVDFATVPETTTSAQVKLAVTNACGVTSAVKTLTLTSTDCPSGARFVAVEEVKPLVNTEIYPNPAAEIFNLDFDSEIRAEVALTIYSYDGNLMMQRKVSFEKGLNTITENVSELRRGIYFVKFINPATNEVIVKKLIKK